MKALVKQSRTPGDLQLCDLPLPEVTEGTILAKVVAAGICRSDFDIIEDRTTIYRPPVVPGHEFSAVVVEVGSAVAKFKPGDHVVSETALGVCDQCPACQDGHFEICDRKEILGWTHNGAFAEYVLLSPRFSHLVDPAVDLLAAAVAEPLAIGVEAVRVRGRLQPGEVVAVVGPGPCGMLSAFAARQLGAAEVFLLGLDSFAPVRMPIARRLGIEHCVNSAQTDAVAYLLDHNRGRLADVVIDASGTIQGFNDSLALVKRHGRLIEVGSITTATPLDWPAVCHKALDLVFVFASSRPAWDTGLDLLASSAASLRHVATHVLPLTDYESALSVARDDSQCLKVLLRPEQSDIV